MLDEQYHRDRRQKLYRPIENWDEMFIAGEWDYLGGLNEVPRFALIAGYIHRHAEQSAVLDAGCGQGHLLSYLDRSRVTYHGFDLSETAIANAIRHYPDARFTVATLESFERSAGERYDAIVFNEVIPHVALPLEAIDRFSGMLKPKGLIIISTYQSPDENSNAHLFTQMFNAEVVAGRYRVKAAAEASCVETGYNWRITILE